MAGVHIKFYHQNIYLTLENANKIIDLTLILFSYSTVGDTICSDTK